MTLDELGRRICVLGPSNSGKSTLSLAIGAALELPVVHLDQLHHLPNTDWRPRPQAEFVALHDDAILGPRWVMDGNYAQLLPQRLMRATGVVFIEVSAATGLFRYLRRSWLERDRAGALEGGRDSVKWDMVRHIAVVTRADRERDEEMFERIGLPKIRLRNAQALDRFYCENGLARRRVT